MTCLLTAATRRTELAVAQTEIVIAALKKANPDIQVSLKKIITGGDRDKRTTLWNLKKSGFFTSQLEDCLLEGGADFAVHSFKDLPTHDRQGLTITAVCDRKFPEDCLVANWAVSSVDELPPAARIGTSSLRRAVQIKRLRPDLKIMPVRGSVPTRLKRLEEGKFDAIILARAGLYRLGLQDQISFCFEPERFIPAPAQGALAVQTRTDDTQTAKLIAAIDDEKARLVTLAERHILAVMRCGCHAPVGAFAEIDNDSMKISAFISDLQGENFITRRITGRVCESVVLAEKLANELLDAGGAGILKNLEK